MAAARKRKTARAARRRAERTVRNLLVKERAQESVAKGKDSKLRPLVARHADQLDFLLMRGLLTADQAKAGARFCQDYERSMTNTVRLVGRYADISMPRRPGKATPPPDTPGTLAARERFELAVRALGPLCGIVIHVAICDLDFSTWGVRPGQRNSDGIALLRFGFAALGEHYGGRWAATSRASSRVAASPPARHNSESSTPPPP